MKLREFIVAGLFLAVFAACSGAPSPSVEVENPSDTSIVAPTKATVQFHGLEIECPGTCEVHDMNASGSGANLSWTAIAFRYDLKQGETAQQALNALLASALNEDAINATNIQSTEAGSLGDWVIARAIVKPPSASLGNVSRAYFIAMDHQHNVVVVRSEGSSPPEITTAGSASFSQDDIKVVIIPTSAVIPGGQFLLGGEPAVKDVYVRTSFTEATIVANATAYLYVFVNGFFVGGVTYALTPTSDRAALSLPVKILFPGQKYTAQEITSVLLSVDPPFSAAFPSVLDFNNIAIMEIDDNAFAVTKQTCASGAINQGDSTPKDYPLLSNASCPATP